MVARASIRAIVAFGVVAGLAGAVACVIADPPAEIPVVPERVPQILHTSAVPSVIYILEAWPQSFVIPIAADPGSTVEYQFFVDDSLKAAAALNPDLAKPDAGVRLLQLHPAAPALDECHTVEMLVALNFAGLHTPDSRGGDSVVWFYNPPGSTGSCPVFDAGVGDSATEGGD